MSRAIYHTMMIGLTRAPVTGGLMPERDEVQAGTASQRQAFEWVEEVELHHPRGHSTMEAHPSAQTQGVMAVLMVQWPA